MFVMLTLIMLKERYLNYGSAPSPHDSDIAVMACFLCIPLVALLYAVLSFAVALGAFSIQSSDTHGRVLLCVVLGILGTAGIGTLLFFWHVWRGPRAEEVSEENTIEMFDYGWMTQARGLIGSIKALASRGLRKLRATQEGKETTC